MKLSDIFPKRRIYPDYPWIIWLIGWLAIYKSFLWLSTEPNLPADTLQILGYKYLIFMIPFAVLGIGIWNLKRWAVWGIILLSAIDLIFYIYVRQPPDALVPDRTSIFSKIVLMLLMIINGPIGDIFILFATPVMLKITRGI